MIRQTIVLSILAYGRLMITYFVCRSVRPMYFHIRALRRYYYPPPLRCSTSHHLPSCIYPSGICPPCIFLLHISVYAPILVLYNIMHGDCDGRQDLSNAAYEGPWLQVCCFPCHAPLHLCDFACSYPAFCARQYSAFVSDCLVVGNAAVCRFDTSLRQSLYVLCSSKQSVCKVSV